MNLTIADVIYAIFATFGIVDTIAYICYKCSKKASTWEAGFLVMANAMLTLLVKIPCLIRWLQDEPQPGTETDQKKVLSNKEAPDLTKKLDGHPYDTPTLETYNPDNRGCAEYEISAVGLKPEYKNLSFVQISTMAYNIIQNYMMETRGIQVAIFIHVATPTRLSFSIALSQKGRERLEKQVQEREQQENGAADTTTQSKPLEETIDLWAD